MGPSLNLTREGTSRPSLLSSLSLSTPAVTSLRPTIRSPNAAFQSLDPVKIDPQVQI